MGRFTINLPGGRIGVVNWGKVKKLQLSLHLRFCQQQNKQVRTGYIFKIEPGRINEKIYHLYKDQEQNWSIDADGKLPICAAHL
jgi:hypothetical protein